MIRRKETKSKLRVPGEIFLKHIKYGTPEIEGIYLCFYKPFPPLAHDNFPVAGMKVGNFFNGKWGMGEAVFAYMGPLPILSLDELTQNDECATKSFGIGTLKQAAQNQYVAHYPQYILAKLDLTRHQKGMFIWEIHTHKSAPIPLARCLGPREFEEIKDPQPFINTVKKLMKCEEPN